MGYEFWCMPSDGNESGILIRTVELGKPEVIASDNDMDWDVCDFDGEVPEWILKMWPDLERCDESSDDDDSTDDDSFDEEEWAKTYEVSVLSQKQWEKYEDDWEKGAADKAAAEKAAASQVQAH